MDTLFRLTLPANILFTWRIWHCTIATQQIDHTAPIEYLAYSRYRSLIASRHVALSNNIMTGQHSISTLSTISLADLHAETNSSRIIQHIIKNCTELTSKKSQHLTGCNNNDLYLKQNLKKKLKTDLITL